MLSLTETTGGAHRAGSRVDFAFTGCCVAPARSSLLLSKRYLSRSSPRIFVEPSITGIERYVNSTDLQFPHLRVAKGYIYRRIRISESEKADTTTQKGTVAGYS